MPYIKFQVRSGGIYIKQKKEYQPLDLDLTDHPSEQGQRVLSLIRESSIKGLFSWLMGETAKVKDIENSHDNSVKKINLTLDSVVKASACKKISEPHITIFFERRDSHRKKSGFVSPSKIDLRRYSFEAADPTIKLLEKPLNNIMQIPSESLEDIRSFFKDHEVNNKKSEEEYNKIRNKKKKLDLGKIPESKLKTGIQTALKRVEDSKPVSSKMIKLIEEISRLCAKDKEFYRDIKQSVYGKFSVFTDLNSTKHWVDAKYHSIVRGKPGFIARADFDIYLSKEVFSERRISSSLSWDELVQKIKSGPGMGGWGEGGIVFIKYFLDAFGCPHDEKDNVFLTINALRQAGVKLKKYDWEERIEKKNAKEKDLSATNEGKNS